MKKLKIILSIIFAVILLVLIVVGAYEWVIVKRYDDLVVIDNAFFGMSTVQARFRIGSPLKSEEVDNGVEPKHWVNTYKCKIEGYEVEAELVFYSESLYKYLQTVNIKIENVSSPEEAKALAEKIVQRFRDEYDGCKEFEESDSSGESNFVFNIKINYSGAHVIFWTVEIEDNDILITGDLYFENHQRENGVSKSLHFIYDESGNPYAVVYNDGSTEKVYYYITNLQGDVTAIVDQNMTVVTVYTYDAWGKVLSATKPNGAAIRANNIGEVNHQNDHPSFCPMVAFL